MINMRMRIHELVARIMALHQAGDPKVIVKDRARYLRQVIEKRKILETNLKRK